MIKRKIKKQIIELAKGFPVISLTGPRQSGKSTLLKNEFKQYEYISLEDVEIRNFALSDPKSFLAKYKKGKVIIDEAQYAPDLFSYIQLIVDEINLPGQFILSGSQNFLMMKSITQSLAGRVGIVKLLPFSFEELESSNIRNSLDKNIYYGAYPRIYSNKIKPKDFYPNYIETYIEKDVKSILNIKDILKFNNFLRICATRAGQILNISSIATDTKISVSTANEWLSILNSSYIISIIPPFFRNIGKRLIKSPKLYFNDTGLLCYLIGIKSKDDLNNSNLYGNLFENCIFTEVFKKFYNEGKQISNLFFYRDSDKNEIDLVIENSYENISLYEIKSGMTGNKTWTKKVNTIGNLLNVNNAERNIIFNGENYLKINDVNFYPWKDGIKSLN